MPSRRVFLQAATAAPVALASGAAAAQQAPGGGPLAGAPAAAGTQTWGADGRLSGPAGTVERVEFQSRGTKVVGNLFVPPAPGRKPAIAVVGPVGFVKEQAPVQYASRLARAGYVTLIFDPRFHGESDGEPRRHESGAAKVEDLLAAFAYLAARPGVEPERIFVLGICQGVNWAIEAALAEPRFRAAALVAGHYLTPDVALMYLGSQAEVDARIARAGAAEEKFKRTGEVDYIPVVSPSLAQPDPKALLTAPPIQMWYIRWADRSPFLAHRGMWENRLTAMSEANIWGYRIDRSVPKLRTPTLMIHADRAASGGQIPRRLYEAIPAARKELVWLGGQGQLQFYEDPITIEQAVPPIARFFAA